MADPKEERQLFEKLKATPQYERFAERPVAYFCAEFAFTNDDQRRYAGGLGVLAGDMVREAADLGFPMVAVGLYYRQGYVCQSKEVGGRPAQICPTTPPRRAGF